MLDLTVTIKYINMLFNRFCKMIKNKYVKYIYLNIYILTRYTINVIVISCLWCQTMFHSTFKKSCTI